MLGDVSIRELKMPTTCEKSKDVKPEFFKYLDEEHGHDSINELIKTGIEKRCEKGLESYESYLQTFNNRPPFIDGYQEILDALLYFYKDKMEGNFNFPPEVNRAIYILYKLSCN